MPEEAGQQRIGATFYGAVDEASLRTIVLKFNDLKNTLQGILSSMGKVDLAVGAGKAAQDLDSVSTSANKASQQIKQLGEAFNRYNLQVGSGAKVIRELEEANLGLFETFDDIQSLLVEIQRIFPNIGGTALESLNQIARGSASSTAKLREMLSTLVNVLAKTPGGFRREEFERGLTQAFQLTQTTERFQLSQKGIEASMAAVIAKEEEQARLEAQIAEEVANREGVTKALVSLIQQANVLSNQLRKDFSGAFQEADRTLQQLNADQITTEQAAGRLVQLAREHGLIISTEEVPTERLLNFHQAWLRVTEANVRATQQQAAAMAQAAAVAPGGIIPPPGSENRLSQLAAGFGSIAQGVTFATQRVDAFIKRLQAITFRTDILGDPFKGFEQRLEAVRAKILATSEELARVIEVPSITGDPFIRQIQDVQKAIGVMERLQKAKDAVGKTKILAESDPELLARFGITTEQVLTGQVQPAVENLQNTLRDLFRQAPERVFPREERLRLLQTQFAELDRQYLSFGNSTAAAGVKTQILNQQMALLNEIIKVQGTVTPQLEADYARLQKEMIQLSSSAQLVRSRWGAALSSIQNFTVLLRSQLAFYTGIGLLFGTIFKIKQLASDFAEFEQTIRNVGAITNATTAELKALSDAARQVGRTTSLSAKDAADGLRILVQAGLSVAEATQAIQSVAQTAILTSSDIKDVVNLLTSTLKIFDIQADRSQDVLNIFAGALNFSRLQIADMATAMNYLGGVSRLAGFTLADTAAAIAVLSNAGIKASTIGTGLSTLLQNLIAPTKQFREELERLGKGAGIENILDTLNPANARSIPVILKTLAEIGFDLTSIFDTLEQRGARALAIAVTQGAERFEEMKRRIQDTDQVAAGFAKSMEGVQAQIRLTNNQLLDAAIGFGTKLAPAIVVAVQAIQDLVNGLTALLPLLSAVAVGFGVWLTATKVILPLIAGTGGIVPALVAMAAGLVILIGHLKTYSDRLDQAGLRSRAELEITKERIIKLLQLQAALEDINATEEQRRKTIENSLTDFPSLINFLKEQSINLEAVKGHTQELLGHEIRLEALRRGEAIRTNEAILENAQNQRKELEQQLDLLRKVEAGEIRKNALIVGALGQAGIAGGVEDLERKIGELNKKIAETELTLFRLKGIAQAPLEGPKLDIGVDPARLKAAREEAKKLKEELERLTLQEVGERIQTQFRLLGQATTTDQIREISKSVLAAIEERKNKAIKAAQEERDKVIDANRSAITQAEILRDKATGDRRDKIQRDLDELLKLNQAADEKLRLESSKANEQAQQDRVRAEQEGNKSILRLRNELLNDLKAITQSEIKIKLIDIDKAKTISDIKAIETEAITLRVRLAAQELAQNEEAKRLGLVSEREFESQRLRIQEDVAADVERIKEKGRKQEEKDKQLLLELDDKFQTALLTSTEKRLERQRDLDLKRIRQSKLDAEDKEKAIFEVERIFDELRKRNQEQIQREAQEENIRNVRSFADAFRVGLEESARTIKPIYQQIAEDINSTLRSVGDSIVNGFSQAFAQTIVQGGSFKDRLVSLMQQISVAVLEAIARVAALRAFLAISGLLGGGGGGGVARLPEGTSITIKTGGLLTKKGVKRFNEGGFSGPLPGYGGGDRIPALLEAGEFVLRKEAVAQYGANFFHALNNMAIRLQQFSLGGFTLPHYSIPLKMAAGGVVGGGGGFGKTMEVTVINVDDPDRIPQIMASRKGKNVIINTFGKDYGVNGIMRRIRY